MVGLAPPRVLVGGLIGLLVYSVDAVATFIRFVLTPSSIERATSGAFWAMFAFLFVFIAGGALAGYLWGVRVRIVRYLSIGALVGAMAWSYLTVTWPLTARPAAIAPPQMSVPGAALFGAGAGALGGLLLLVLASVRSLREKQ